MTIFKIAINNLLRRKSRIVFIVLSLTIGIATMTSIYSVVDTIRNEMTKEMAQYGANIVITPDRGEFTFSYGGIIVPEILFDVGKLTMSDVDKMNLLPDKTMIRGISPKILGIVSLGGQDMIISGGNFKNDFAIKPWIKFAGGTEIIPTNNEVIVGKAIAETLGLQTGEKIKLKNTEFVVVGILEENGTSEDNQILMDLKTAQTLLERQNELTVIELAADYSKGSENTLIANIQKLLPNAEITSLRQVVLGRNELLNNLIRFGLSITILILLTAMLVIGLTVTASVRERTREIGIFRAIGFRKANITAIIIIESIILSLFGGVAGFALGMIIANFTAPFLTGITMFIPIKPELMGISVLLSIIIACVASIYPAYRATRLDPVAAMRFI